MTKTENPRDKRPPRSEKLKATEEITELAPNVLRTQLPIDLPGLGHVNCYLLQDGDGIAVVDPGLPGDASWKALIDRLRRADYKVTDIHTVVITHSHFDHYGGAERIRQEAGARIVAHANLSNWMRSNDSNEVDELGEFVDVDDAAAQGSGPTSRYGRKTPWGTWSEPPPEVIEHWKTLGVGEDLFIVPKTDVGLNDTQQIMLAGRPWVAVHTPGHTADHLCLYDAEEGLMITGDHVLPTITPHISGLADDEAPLTRFLDSLNRMHDYADVKLALPAHGAPFDDLVGRADHICDHHLERLNDIRQAAEELEGGSVEQYMQRCFPERSWGDMAVSETYAHLDHLRDHGELFAHWHDDGLLHFSHSPV